MFAGTRTSPDLANFFRPAQEITAEACGVSLSTVKRVCAESKKNTNLDGEHETTPSFKSPRKSYKRQKPITDLADVDSDVVRRTVHSFYDEGEFPTTGKILAALQEKINYKGGKLSIQTILSNLNFKYKKCHGGGKFLMERSDIVATRVSFLRKMSALRQNNDTRPVVYLYETRVNQNLKLPIGKGGRYIICHAGSGSFGFVQNSKLVFLCKSDNSINYHSQMNSDAYELWFEEMLRHLKESCVIVMNNTPHHLRVIKEYPKSNSKKSDLQKWLREKSVDFSPFETLCELRERVKLLVPKEKKYKLDHIALTMGHEVVRLPPYHCQYNPIHQIWTHVAGQVAGKKSKFKISDIEILVNNALVSVSMKDWERYVNHCNKIQEEDLIKEGLRDDILEPIITTINPDDSNASEDDDDYDF